MAGGQSGSLIVNTLHAYPTLSEGVRYACQAGYAVARLEVKGKDSP